MSVFGMGKVGVGAAGVAAVLALVAGCASSSSAGNQGAGASGTTHSNPGVSGSAGLKSRSTSIGPVLVDASGHTVYELVGDPGAKQTCTGSCLSIWPAVTTNGSQMIVNGHPAFTFAGDKAAGQTNGQNVTDQWGRWLALDASGNPITATTGSTAPASQSPPTKSKAPTGGGPAF